MTEQTTAAADALLMVREFSVAFAIKPRGGWFWQPAQTLLAVNNVSFTLRQGETLGIVGESGCGKSTLARAIMGLVPARAGRVLWLGQDLLDGTESRKNRSHQQIQMVFQDPLAALNPRMTIGRIIGEPLRTCQPELSGAQVLTSVVRVMRQVGLDPALVNRYPHEFSGGQCQRVGIARALILEPAVIICDEPVSALDVSIQAQVINLLKALQQSMGLSLIFIAHDLAVVKYISHRILVMYLGNVVELADAAALFAHPLHPYTRALIAAVPVPDPAVAVRQQGALLSGELPSPLNPPSGCVFRTRCTLADATCASQQPVLRGDEQHQVACLHREVHVR